jgi:hypothetical protein
VRKTKNNIGSRLLEGHITDTKNTRMVEKSRRQREWRRLPGQGLNGDAKDKMG